MDAGAIQVAAGSGALPSDAAAPPSGSAEDRATDAPTVTSTRASTEASTGDSIDASTDAPADRPGDRSRTRPTNRTADTAEGTASRPPADGAGSPCGDTTSHDARTVAERPPDVGRADGCDALHAETLDRLRLAATAGVSPRTIARWIARFGSAGAVLTAPPELLARVPGVGGARAGLLRAAPTRADACRDLDRARAAGATILFPGSPGWPEALDELADPPPVLFVRGDLAAALAGGAAPEPLRAVLRGRGVAIVGSRRASAYGAARAQSLARELASVGVPVVSGLARGVDAAAHRGALDGGGQTLGVLGGGLARFYPPENVPLAREIVCGRGAVVSEFALDMPPLPHHFPRRNRLLAAFAVAVVVVEAAERSGSLVTADHALDLGREVLAVPGRVDAPNSRGVHRLLREGAALCEGIADVLRAVGIDAQVAPADTAETPAAGHGGSGTERRASTTDDAPPCGRTEAALLAALAEEELDADALLERTGLDPSSGLVALTALELRAAIVQGRDGRYARTV